MLSYPVYFLLTRSSTELKHYPKFVKTKTGNNQVKQLRQKLVKTLIIEN